MQATLLDLIDRHVITASDEELTCHLNKPMTSYEAEVLDIGIWWKRNHKN